MLHVQQELTCLLCCVAVALIVQPEAKLMDLQQQQKLSQVQLQTLKSRIDMQRQRLHEVTRKLAAHKG